MLRRRDIWLRSLLPNEPRILYPTAEAELTTRYLQPSLTEVEICLLAVRIRVDGELQRLQPTKLGRPYPLGQCLEIVQAVEKCLRTAEECSLPMDAAIGLRALRAFQRAGGTFRRTWGDLRGQYFQNAFQVGTLYIDVANDTVTPTKPKVEILPFDEAKFIPIRDFEHFSQIACSYWGDEVYPNHVLPKLAPHCPLIHVSNTGRMGIHEATQYMLAMTRGKAFHPSEAALRLPPMPQDLFDKVCKALNEHGYHLPNTPEQGRQQALQYCRQYRAKRWHQAPKLLADVIWNVQQVNLRLARWHHTPTTQESTMPIINIDNKDYELDTLSDETKAQLASLQFVDAELQRLNAQIAIMQTARMAYAKALNEALSVSQTLN